MLLVVDNDDDTREMLQLALEDEGYEVRAASDGYEAIDIMQESPPSLVLLDLMIAPMTSWQLVDRMRDDPLLAEVPICVMADGAETSSVDAVCVVPKPIGVDRLLELVREQLA